MADEGVDRINRALGSCSAGVLRMDRPAGQADAVLVCYELRFCIRLVSTSPDIAF